MARWFLIIMFFLQVVSSRNSWGSSPSDTEVPTVPADIITPTAKVDEGNWPELIDDLEFDGMDLALDRQIKRFSEKALKERIRFGNDIYPAARIRDSLVKFKQVVEVYKECERSSGRNCKSDFRLQMKKDFNLYAPNLASSDPRFGEDKATLFTAYYTPSILASKVKTEEYKYPVYKHPVDRKRSALPRVDIDFKDALNKLNLELFYTNNLFELYLLHAEGGGKITYVDGSKDDEEYLSYDGTNGQKWTFISRYMQSKGMISNPSVQAQRNYLTAHPEKNEEIYTSCPSYVFFKKTHQQPLGSDTVSLTNNRSIATDTKYYPYKGALAFVSAARPRDLDKTKPPPRNVEFRKFSRFYLDQDTGGAIRGKARVDLYFGEGKYAELAAHNTVERGDLYFLMLKP
jgi:membrane-bound lytic murein transglycosylase A